ncbi:hypothetical protein BH10ACI2_BH10ACI2_18630 [soil metagenome]
MKDTLPIAGFKDRILYRLGRLRGFLVEGDSMSPTIKNCERVLIRPGSDFAIGDIVLAAHPYKRSVKILKRAIAIDAENNITLIGDNPHVSTDSRTFGAVSIESILGRAVSRLK